MIMQQIRHLFVLMRRFYETTAEDDRTNRVLVKVK